MVFPGTNTYPTTHISLVHASDSVRAVMGTIAGSAATRPSTSTSSVPYASASSIQKMSKPPVRVVAQPPPPPPPPLHQNHHHHHSMYAATQRTSLPTMSVQPMAGRVGAEFGTLKRDRGLVDYDDAPRSAYQHQQHAVEIVQQRVRAVRRQVADEETELRRLRELERETAILRERNANREHELAAESSKLADEQTVLRNATLRVKSLTKHLEEMYKRRQTASAAALVEHRKLQQNRNAATEAVVRPRASVEPFQVTTSPDKDETAEKTTTDGKESEAKEQQASPSPPKDPHPNPPPPSCLSTFASPALSTFEQKINSSTRDSPNAFGECLDESRLRSGKTDLVSLRSDSLKATKRRSWAASEGTSMTEAEMIHRLLDEQRRGRNHFIPQLPTPHEETIPEVTSTEETVSVTTTTTTTAAAAASTTNSNPTVDEPESPMTVEPPTSLMDQMMIGSDTTTEEETSSCSTRSVDELNLEMEVAQEKRVIKSILRRPNEKLNKGRIEFDPLALLLEAALEGDLDLVKSSSAKLVDVSQANDEGITALHNAICAGHYEIVRFLIEHDADVNAQDSDGWTPLHCAASCNNLPMVRQLVEGGACVLAATLSDMETPVEKCEEEEDGYDGCLKYLVAAHSSTGNINNGKVYAVYSYEAEYEDELSFDAGDELVVLSKDDVDMHWWTCRNSNGDTGLVPRTYLSLYPALKYRKKLNFVMFDLPLEANNNLD
ncbi:unnamed protein product [Caenorhabditis bovis]|uniref:SH3 domain-containing protein n=1 Tax=Caenorhabditis bovis TaxID=2654633 RepID=A0A8S1ED19_9PELO|nr:unnamed protein product [Caenorhabditis bovis]